MKNPFDTLNNQNDILTGLEYMGDNIRKGLAYCGENVVLYPLCKIIRPEHAKIDDFSRILDFTFIDAGKELTIGKHAMITWQVVIEGGARTHIGDRVFIGPGSKLLTSTYQLHGMYSAEFIPEGTHNFIYGDINLENDAYIGANCVLLPGVSIGEGAVAGAGCIVNKDLEPWGIYVGTPCKKIGTRTKPSEEIRKKLYSETDWTLHF